MGLGKKNLNLGTTTDKPLFIVAVCLTSDEWAIWMKISAYGKVHMGESSHTDILGPGHFRTKISTSIMNYVQKPTRKPGEDLSSAQ